MLSIYLVRHGQNEDNVNGILNGHRDLPLTKIGIEQAKNLALHLEKTGIRFDKIYSSPLSRAYRTAEIIADHLGLDKPEKRDGLIERNFGDMTGRKISDIEKLYSPHIIKTNTVTYVTECPGSETFPDLIERAKKLISDVQKERAGGNVLLVCHGDIGKMIYAAFYGIDWKDALKNFHFGNSEIVLLSPGRDPKDAHIFKQEQFNH
ncbi:MAG: histidine phosphatase family protein [Candidatus Taylorbacteria bacterium]|nr:histidine phosphatase family protein [Candidatus Taylorbacteria bacterium]